MSRINSETPVATGLRSNRYIGARSHGTTDFGRIDVLYHTEVNPNEDFSVDWKGRLKGAIMPAATRANMYYDVRWFFVPYRILTHRPEEGKQYFVWDYFINHLSNTTHPYTTLRDLSAILNESNYWVSSDQLVRDDCRRLMSQMRLPEGVYNSSLTPSPSLPFSSKPVNLWPALSYQRIWWDFYRDKSLVDESLLSQYIPLPSAGVIGFSSTGRPLQSWFTPRYACWPKDYFTNARQIPGTDGNAILLDTVGVGTWESKTIDNDPVYQTQGTVDDLPMTGDISGMYQGQSTTGSLTVAALRMAKLVDNYLQRLNISGTSIINRIFARFGIRPQDKVSWNAQYLGGKRYDFSVGDVLGNIESGDTGSTTPFNAFGIGASGTYQGQSTGIVYSHFDGKSFNFHSGSDYGTLMCVGSLVPYTGYYQGLHKSWTHGTQSNIADARTSYLTPEFANAGLQPITKSELWANAAAGTGDLEEIFGWSERYGEYAFQQDTIDGDIVFAGTKAGMDALHLFRIFNGKPSLTPAFTQIDPAARLSLDRIFQFIKTGDDSSGYLLDHFERFFVFDVNCNRAMASSMTPDLFEDNNHGNVISVPVGGTRF